MFLINYFILVVFYPVWWYNSRKDILIPPPSFMDIPFYVILGDALLLYLEHESQTSEYSLQKMVFEAGPC